MITTPHIKLIHDINIIMDNVSLKKVNEIKFLGVIVDSQVNFKSLTGIIFKVRDFLTIDSLRIIYFSLIYSYFLYGAAI